MLKTGTANGRAGIQTRQLLLSFLKKDMGLFYQCDSVYVSFTCTYI